MCNIAHSPTQPQPASGLVVGVGESNITHLPCFTPLVEPEMCALKCTVSCSELSLGVRTRSILLCTFLAQAQNPQCLGLTPAYRQVRVLHWGSLCPLLGVHRPAPSQIMGAGLRPAHNLL